MRNSRWILLLIVCFVYLGGCRAWGLQRFKSEDPFYAHYDDGADADRFPLIKPYDAIKVSEKNGWIVSLKILSTNPDSNIFGYHQLVDVKKVAIKNDVIMAYTPYIDPYAEGNGEMVLHWFVIVPDQKIETGFENEKDFLVYIKGYNITEPLWLGTDFLFDQFYETGCLDWIPDCK